jgi:alpha-tubulin suppressor-like RCC1 family protein
VTTTGEVACWGVADDGSGTAVGDATPALVPGLTDVVAVTSGSGHSCALRKTRDVVCWGTNTSGELGNGRTDDQSEPVPVSNLSNVRSVSAGGRHTCALLDSGSVVCWGDNTSGQAGPDAAAVQTLPIAVSGIAEARAVSAGGRNTCALLEAGEVSCWGWAWEDTVGVWSAEPSLLPGISDALQVSAGLNHDCVVLTTGEAACRGYGRQGQLGDGDNGTKDDPQTVLNLGDATRIAAGDGGYGHTCALREAGDVVCWGINTDGQLGNSSTESTQSSPGEPVLHLDGVVSLGAGAEHTCALQGDGHVACWGKGDRGQLGNGAKANQGAGPVSGLLAATCP